jgi:hypothetical protein
VTQGQPRIVGNARKQGPLGPHCLMHISETSGFSLNSSHAELSRIARAFRHVSKEVEYIVKSNRGTVNASTRNHSYENRTTHGNKAFHASRPHSSMSCAIQDLGMMGNDRV